MNIYISCIIIGFLSSVLTVRSNILTMEQLHLVLCVETIAHRYFTPGHPLIVSLPATAEESTSRQLIQTTPHKDDLQLVNFMLQKLNEGTRWPIELFRPNEDEIADAAVLHHSYILFVWLEEEASLNKSLENQVEYLKYSASWNPRGRFVVVMTGHSGQQLPQIVATHVCAILWQMSKIVNVVVLIPGQEADPPLTTTGNKHRRGTNLLNLYTWFPYHMGSCGEVGDAVLQVEWVCEHNGRFSGDVNLYPERVPKDLMGCPIRVASVGIEPYLILTDNYTRNDGSVEYKLTGLSVEILRVVCKKMNLTTIFLSPSIGMKEGPYMKEASDLQDDISDVLTGVVPLLSHTMSSFFDPTIPYTHSEVKMLVPCPKQILINVLVALGTYTKLYSRAYEP
ncbi:uncharacterized protein LOC110840925 [Zootermopsis nevadensis]|uniref:uncharacterized protein LOC110840925 n=1 Tax=Zootermopsis nevadensis TaxID=136037 RepID=UPI000B8ECA77|nr:uncharacterized protein LOC110840925 [Zootermopsis nevadensis]